MTRGYCRKTVAPGDFTPLIHQLKEFVMRSSAGRTCSFHSNQIAEKIARCEQELQTIKPQKAPGGILNRWRAHLGIGFSHLIELHCVLSMFENSSVHCSSFAYLVSEIVETVYVHLFGQ